MSIKTIKTLVISTDMPDAVAQAVAVLAAGGLVAFPTDTVYGVGAHALLPDAVKRLFAAKVRPEGKAIPLLLGEAADLERVSCDVPALAWRLIAALWQGALTLVELRGPLLPHIDTAGQAAAITADAVLAQLDGRIELLLDGGPCAGGVASTVVDLTVQPPAILRPGALDLARLRRLLAAD